ncbi:MAG: B12-binding domain-containing radical SAM protein [Myxococcota bacterium]|jgi:hypothetical protein|nr:B12-binding domain-containing radical SAM protein [Myxococcota bacterium]
MKDARHKRSRDPLLDERGTIRKAAPCIVALGYPARYEVGIASLGAQQVYRLLNEQPGVGCERFYADDLEARGGPRTLESALMPGNAAAVAFSIACETELAVVAGLLEACGLPPLCEHRHRGMPPVLVGGPLTLIDPWLVAPLADVVVVGDAEPSLHLWARALLESRDKEAFLAALGALFPGVWRPQRDAEPPLRAAADLSSLPARAAVWTPRSELSDLFLVEAARGCDRGCAFCVMSAKAKGACGMRPVPMEAVLEAIPQEAKGVGLVGAAVTDHEEIAAIVRRLSERGQRSSLSSIRADRLSDELARSLVAGGAQSLTLAADGSSERLRRSVHKGITEKTLTQAVHIAATAGIRNLKLYSMVGLPTETDEDIAEFARLCLDLGRIVRLSLAVQAFVPKPGTPLAASPMERQSVLRGRLRLLERLLQGRVRLSSTSPRLAALDAALAQLGPRAALVAVAASRGGRTFPAWRRALAEFAPEALCAIGL